MLRFIVADDQPVVCRGLKEIMRESFADLLVDEASLGREVIDRIEEQEYDLALFDIAFRDLDGLEVLEQVKKKKPRLPVLVVSLFPEEDYAMRVIRAGGNGYLSKRSSPEELVRVVHKILAGKRYVSPAFAEKMLFDAMPGDGKKPHERLSNREFQVACMIGKGKTMREITEELRVSINTVRTYRVRIFQKIGIKGTNELIRYAMKHSLVE